MTDEADIADAVSPADAEDAVVVPADQLPQKRGPGRPAGSKNRDRVATIERITREGDPLGYRLRALRRGWINAAPTESSKHRERVYLTADEMLRLAGALEDKILPRLRSIEVTGEGIGNSNTLINVMDGLGENQLKSLISALQADPRQSQRPHVIENEPDTANAVVQLRPPHWKS